MERILVRAEAVEDKIILYKEDFSFEDLLAKGATLTPGVGYLKLNGREVSCFFSEKREGQNIEYEPIISDYRCAELKGKSYMEIYDLSLKGGKESLDAFIWEGEFGITEEIPLEAYHKIEFADGDEMMKFDFEKIESYGTDKKLLHFLNAVDSSHMTEAAKMIRQSLADGTYRIKGNTAQGKISEILDIRMIEEKNGTGVSVICDNGVEYRFAAYDENHSPYDTPQKLLQAAKEYLQNHDAETTLDYIKTQSAWYYESIALESGDTNG